MQFLNGQRIVAQPISRDELLAKLLEPLPLLTLVAPVGYGKSTLLSQVAQRTPCRGFWLSAHLGISAPQPFLAAFGAAARRAEIVDDEAPFAAIDVDIADAQLWSEFAAWLQASTEHFCVIIDDAEHLRVDTLTGLLQLLREVPNMHLRVAAQFDPHGLLHDSSLVVDAALIGQPELALSVDEIAEVTGLSIDAPLVAEIAQSGGSMALVQAVSTSREGDLGSQMNPLETVFRLRSAKWEKPFTLAFAKLSVAEYFDLRLIEKITKVTNGDQMLSRLWAEGLITREMLTLDNGVEDHLSWVYRIVPAFHAAGMQTALRLCTPVELAQLQAEISRWRVSSGRAIDALKSAIASGQTAVIRAVFLWRWEELLLNRWLVHQMFACFSDQMLRKLPLALVFLALTDNRLARSHRYFSLAQTAIRRLKQHTRTPVMIVLCAAETCMLRVYGGEAQQIRKPAMTVMRLMATLSESEMRSLGRIRTLAYLHTGLSFFYLGERERALECFRNAYMRTGADSSHAGQGIANEAGALSFFGDMPESNAAAQRAKSMRWPSGWLVDYHGSMLVLADTLHALELGDADAASAELAKLQPLRDWLEHWALIEQLDALVALMQGEPERAIMRLRRARTAQRERRAFNSMQSDLVYLTQALIHTVIGDSVGAQNCLAKTRATSAQTIAKARLALSLGKAVKAMALLNALPRESMSSRETAEAMMLTAGATALLAEAGQPSRGAAPLLKELDLFLRDRALFVPVFITPVAALEAMLRQSHGWEQELRHLRMLLTRALDMRVKQATSVRPVLTPREKVVAEHLLKHRTVADIAEDLTVSVNTVKTQLRSIYKKLGVSTRTEAISTIAYWSLLD